MHPLRLQIKILIKLLTVFVRLNLNEMNYKFHTCIVCNETRIDMKMKNNMCNRCFIDKLPVKMFSKENKMDPGIVPPELSDLTIIEQQLISRI